MLTNGERSEGDAGIAAFMESGLGISGNGDGFSAFGFRDDEGRVLGVDG